jgi:hypothetical protein
MKRSSALGLDLVTSAIGVSINPVDPERQFAFLMVGRSIESRAADDARIVNQD